MDTIYKTGDRAPISGIYIVLDDAGRPFGPTVSVAEGEAFPLFQKHSAGYQLRETVAMTLTTATSSSSISQVTIALPSTLDYLAKR